MTKQRIFQVLILVAVMIFSQSLLAQVFIKKSGPGEGEVFFLNELAAIVTDEDGTIKVEHAMPGDQRPDGYRDLDLKQGDEILMVNAKRVKKAKDLENIYNEVKVGETIKLGIRRGEEMFILEFNKIDPEKLPKRKLMIRKAEPGEDESGADTKVTTRRIKIENPDGKVKFLMGTGIIIKETENQVEIEKLIPEINEELGDLDLKEGDIILSVNGEKVKTLKQFTDIYDKIKVGDDVQITTARGDEQINLKFKKPEEKGRILIKEK